MNTEALGPLTKADLCNTTLKQRRKLECQIKGITGGATLPPKVNVGTLSAGIIRRGGTPASISEEAAKR